MDREGIAVEDVLDGSNFFVVVVFLKVVSVQSAIQESYCGVLVLGGVVKGVWNDGVSEGRFLVNTNFPVSGGSMNGNVKEVYLVVCLACCRELEFRVYCIEVL